MMMDGKKNGSSAMLQKTAVWWQHKTSSCLQSSFIMIYSTSCTNQHVCMSLWISVCKGSKCFFKKRGFIRVSLLFPPPCLCLTVLFLAAMISSHFLISEMFLLISRRTSDHSSLFNLCQSVSRLVSSICLKSTTSLSILVQSATSSSVRKLD